MSTLGRALGIVLVSAAAGSLAFEAISYGARRDQKQAPAPTGWALTCADKNDASAWIDTGETAPPFSAVAATLFWGPTPLEQDAAWARAEGGGKVAVYATIPHGVWVWPRWQIGEAKPSGAHPVWCP